MSVEMPTEMDTLRPATPSDYPTRSSTPTKYLTHLPKRPPVDIEFSDLSYTVPTVKGTKIILRNISGLFRSGHLTAILGPSGAGKSTLLNILAGYKTTGSSGTVLTNGQPRDMSLFRKLSRYIMQQDLLQPKLTVHEAMVMSANLKLGDSQTKQEKLVAISEILEMLRLNNSRDTYTDCLSGGEKKRLSVALELVNNPPVIFLDEPTTGLDDLSSSQCISLLKLLAAGGRTIICSIHTPSARIFAMFDHVYIVAQGSCVFQGSGSDIVSFLKLQGLTCPTTYNPADFVIEVSSGEYGNFNEKMSIAVDNGKTYKWCLPAADKMEEQPVARTSPIQTSKNEYNFSSSGWTQFRILLWRMFLQTYRDSMYLLLKLTLYIFVALVVGGMFYGLGNDGSKTLFNFGFCLICLIVMMYVPLLPVLSKFPDEVQLLKREYFNRWYGLTSYFFAMTIAQLPVLIFLGTVYVVIVYTMTSQPMEVDRFLLFWTTLIFTCIISESFGLALSSFLNIVNGSFVGPAISVPLMLLAVYGLGYGEIGIPIYWRLLMYTSYLRYGLEALILSLYGNNRPNMECPEEEIYCHYRNPRTIIEIAGMQNSTVLMDLSALVATYILFRAITFLVLRYRLSTSKKFEAIHRISRIVKAQFDITRNLT